MTHIIVRVVFLHPRPLLRQTRFTRKPPDSKNAMKSPRAAKSPRKAVPSAEEKDDLAQLKDYLTRFLQTEPSAEDVSSLRTAHDAPHAPPVSPMVVDRLCYEIEKRGFSHGIFRVPGASFKTRALFVALGHLKTGEEVMFKSEPNVHNLAAALTLYLTRTEPIFPFALYPLVLSCVQVGCFPLSFQVS
jgi:hypothetical protein